MSRLAGPQLDVVAVGSPQRLGVIIATTTSKNNHDTATPFNNTGDALKGKVVWLVSDVAATFKTGNANTVSAAATDFPLEANTPWLLSMPSTHGWVACRANSGTANIQVYEAV